VSSFRTTRMNSYVLPPPRVERHYDWERCSRDTATVTSLSTPTLQGITTAAATTTTMWTLV